MSSDKIDELIKSFVVLIVQTMKDAVFNVIEDEEEENEELQKIIGELKELGFDGELEIFLNLFLSFSDEDGDVQVDKPAVKFDMRVNKSSEEDAKMSEFINLSPEEIADMEKAVAEVRGESGGESQPATDDDELTSVPRTAEEIISSISEYARQYMRPFDRHIFIFIFAKASVFSILGDIMPGERDPRVIRYLADIGIWIKKIEEIIELIMALPDENQKMEMLYLVEEYLRQCLEIGPR